MNWIKITPETELPKENVIGWVNDGWEVGKLMRDEHDITYLDITRSMRLLRCTHYCIITPPNEK